VLAGDVVQAGGQEAAACYREEMAASMRNYNEHVAVPLTARSHDEVSAFFAGPDLIEPGVVQLHRWRAGTGDPGTGRELANYGGVGRKP
jgi:S-adenosyl methyltransferase